MDETLPKVYLVRHGETAWTISGQHTGRTDISLTTKGENDARGLNPKLCNLNILKVFSSPLLRARETAELSGFGEKLEIDNDMMEWNYGDYEGRRTSDIRSEHPNWRLFEDGWIGLNAVEARRLHLATASLSILGYDHYLDEPVILVLNDE